ncbi:hypothetical protein [Rhodopseudomonas sp.]|uniref:hypothetical protein n=1 Tax=Rhodopseudomonas sp. TaxID=1078 RepID=UPI003B3B395A
MTTTTTKTGRRRRFASDEAHAWARNLRLGNPHAKSLLRAIALYSNDEGSCIAGIGTLAEDTDLSPDTVRKRLAFLEEIGAIIRLPRFLDDKGRANTEGRGKRTTDDIRMQLDADVDLIEARARGDLPADDDDAAEGCDPADEGVVSPRHQQGLNEVSSDVQPSVRTRLALGQPSDSSEGLISEPEPEPSPQPPSGGSVSQAEPDGWKDFEADWAEPIVRHQLAMNEWVALSDADRLLARQAARGYVAWRKGQKKPPNVLSAHLFLRDRGAWPGFAARAPDAPARAAESDLPWIVEGSAEDRVIRWLYRRTNVAQPLIRAGDGGKRGYRARKPIGADLLAMAEHVDQRAWRLQTSDEAGEATPQRVWLWGFYPQGSAEYAAWQRRFRDWTGAGLPNERDDAGRQGIRMPRPWPPRVDGTWAAGGADDEQGLADEGGRG